MSAPNIDDPRVALEDYTRAVRDARASALEGRARIKRAEAALAEVREAVVERRRRAAKLAEKRKRPS